MRVLRRRCRADDIRGEVFHLAKVGFRDTISTQTLARFLGFLLVLGPIGPAHQLGGVGQADILEKPAGFVSRGLGLRGCAKGTQTDDTSDGGYRQRTFRTTNKYSQLLAPDTQELRLLCAQGRVTEIANW